MKRREFITLLGSAALTLPLAARAQQPAMPVIGFLNTQSPEGYTELLRGFRQGLKEAGFVEGQNVAIEYRSAEEQVDRLPALVADLIRRPVTVIVGNNASALAAKAASTTVPIVFATGADPVASGLVASLARPGGNVTGVVFFNADLGAKRLELLRQLVPKAMTIAVIIDSHSPNTEAQRRDAQAAALLIGQQLLVFDVSSERDLEPAFATSAQHGAGALLASAGPLLFSNRERLVALAARHALPASYAEREYVLAGGLMSYGTSVTDAYRQAGIYAGRILKGEKPAELPVMQAIKFELVLNLKTAKVLGLDVPDRLLVAADEVIE
jgi:ABC-type uncharacterized transport system substrate-binding protein